MQLAAIVLSLITTVIGIALATRAGMYIYKVVKTGQPDDTRTGQPVQRAKTVGVEFLGHTRMNRWAWSASRTGSSRSASSPWA